MRTRTLRTAELFSGAGLLGHGFSLAGFRSCYACDVDADALTGYAHNIAPVAEYRSVRNVRADVQCEVLLAGPPCQGFSTLGSRDPRDHRNRLSLVIADWARSSRAKVVVIENVPPFLQSPHWNRLRTQLTAQGFETTEWVLDAFDFGAPQRRTRAFAVASTIGLPEQPRRRRNRTTVRQAFRDLPSPNVDPLNVPSQLGPVAKRRITKIPPGGDWRDILRDAPDLCPPSWFKLGCHATDVWGRMEYDEPSNTVRCCFQNPSKGRYIHPVKDRTLTLREGARLQGIPDSWMLFGHRTSIARQIGNGVPVQLANAVAKQIYELFI